MEITAIFEDVDSAEQALIRLREQGVDPLGYKIKRLRPLPGQGESHAVSSVNNPPAFTLSVWNMNESRQTDTRPAAGREVLLSVNVEDASGIRAHRSLVSNHGRRVQYR